MAEGAAGSEASPPLSEGAGSGGQGRLSMPAYGVAVKAHVPPSIAFYWVLKQNISRLRDAISDERADRRLEFIFGFSGLALGTLRDAWNAMSKVGSDQTLEILDFMFSVLFVVSVFAIIYFWRFVRPRSSAVDSVLTEITAQEYSQDEQHPPR